MNINTMPLEADTRILINNSLTNLGWHFDGKDKNVFLEQPKSEKERKKLGGKRPDYVLYSKDKPLIVIEAKRKGVRIDAALEQGINYARTLGAPLVFATDGIFCKTYHTGANRPPILNGEEVDEFIREALALRFLSYYEVNTISPKVQYDRKELIRIFDEANNMLRGDGLRAGIERFGEFANILFLKLISENEQIKKESGVQSEFDIASCSWDSIKNIAPSARIEYINNTVYSRLNKLYDTEIFTPLTIRDETILKEIMDKLDPLTLTDVDSDVKGDAFEFFLKASTATKNDLGEYFTPRHIVKTMVRLVNPKIGEKIYDPFCGTGGFLIESFRHIERNIGTGNYELKRILRQETIYGNEITNTARITKMNMILAGDGHSNIHMKDSLANPTYIDKIKRDDKGKIVRDQEGNIEYSSEYSGLYDVVITNMPYSQKTKHGNLYDLPSTNGDSICVQHCMKAVNSTSENGRMALVVPEGFLFRKDLAKTREYLLDRCQLQSIISLPQGVFLPYTGVKTDIIYATRVNQKLKSSEKKKNYWYFEVNNDGYTLDNHRRKLNTSSDLTKYEEYRKLDEEQAADMLKMGFEIIPLDKVRKNSYILVGSRYREQKIINTKYDVVAIGSVATLQSGYAFPTALQGQAGTIPFYKVSDMNSVGNEVEMTYSNNYVTEELADSKKWAVSPAGTVVFPKIGAAIATNKKRILSRSAIFDNNVMGIICGDKILPKFMLYMLEYIDISNWASLANPPSITQEVVREQKIPLPSLEMQQQIITELEGYQRVIDGAQKVIANYMPKLPNFNNGVKVTLNNSDLFEIHSGGTPDSNKQEYWNGDVNWITLADLPTDDYITRIQGSLRKITQDGLIHSSAKLLPAGTVVVSTRATIGRVGIAQVPLATNQGFKNVVVKDMGIILPDFLALLLREKALEMRRIASGATFLEISKSNFEKLEIMFPPLDEQKAILEQIKYEQTLIDPSKKIIEVFSEKIKERIKSVWGE